MPKAVEVFPAELVCPLVIGAGDEADLESHGMGVRPCGHLAEEEVEWASGGE